MIELSEYEAIGRDKHQWIFYIRQCRKRNEKEILYWRAMGFYPNLELILDRIVQEGVSTHEYEDMQSLMVAYKDSLTQLSTSLNERIGSLMSCLEENST